MVQYKNILIPVDGSGFDQGVQAGESHIAERNDAALYLIAMLDKKIMPKKPHNCRRIRTPLLMVGQIRAGERSRGA